MKIKKRKIKLVSLTGLPGVGKTTLCKLLSDLKDEVTFIEHPVLQSFSLPNDRLIEFINHQKNYVNIWLEFLSNKIKICNHEIIICDRGFEDINCFTDFVLTTNFKIPLNNCLSFRKNNLGLFTSDICIYIEVNQNIRSNRCQIRNKKTKGRGLNCSNDYWNFYKKWCKMNNQILSVDFSDYNQFECCQKLYNLLNL